MNTSIQIYSQPASLSVNFDELKQEIEQHVATYDVVVTSDGVKDAKKQATELNQQADLLDTKRKEVIAEVTKPIREADDQMKELVSLYRDGRQKILQQVKKFEDETRQAAESELRRFRDKTWERLEVEPDFRSAEFADLVKLSALTAKGNLTAAAKRELTTRCEQDKALQDRRDLRILELENRSYKAGLSEPLTADHVGRILLADDEEYEREIERIVGAEVQRQGRIEQAERERAEKRQQEQPRAEPPPPAPEPAPVQEKHQEPPAPAPAGKVAWEVRCAFRLEVSERITKDQIEGELRRVLEEKAGITTLESVGAIRQAGGRS